MPLSRAKSASPKNSKNTQSGSRHKSPTAGPSKAKSNKFEPTLTPARPVPRCPQQTDDDDDDDDSDCNDTNNEMNRSHFRINYGCGHGRHCGQCDPLDYNWFVEPDPDEYPDQDEPRRPCMTLRERPNATWDKEIVKFDPCAEWDPKVEEEGQTGRPKKRKKKSMRGKKDTGNYNNSDEGEDGGNSNSIDSNDEDGDSGNNDNINESEGSDDVAPAIGESKHAYKCYVDSCLPPGLVYCTPKRPQTQPCDPPCPAAWPKRPDEIPICPDKDKDPDREGNRCICNNTDGDDHEDENCSNFDPDFPEDPRCMELDDQGQGRSRCGKKPALPPEWLMHVPKCDCGPVNLPVPTYGKAKRLPCSLKRDRKRTKKGKKR